MVDVNQVVLIGRLTRDAVLKYTTGGKAVCKFSIAVNKRRKSGDGWKDEAGFFDIVFWGQLGESLDQYLVKGKQVAVTGDLTQERWEHDGQNHSKVVVTAATIQLLGGSSSGDGAGQKQSPAPAAPTSSKSDSFNFDDDIPF